jgi:hypothetical protein
MVRPGFSPTVDREEGAMPVKERTPKERRHQLNHEQEQELWLGPTRRGSAFADAAQAQWAWTSNRNLLMQRYARGARRPLAWWKFESSVAWPGRDHERAALFRAEVLADDERAELVACWRAEFDKAQQDGFRFCAGLGRFLQGATARRAHYRWADIPNELVQRWSAQQLTTAA